jgi:hypothetical protein
MNEFHPFHEKWIMIGQYFINYEFEVTMNEFHPFHEKWIMMRQYFIDYEFEVMINELNDDRWTLNHCNMKDELQSISDELKGWKKN